MKVLFSPVQLGRVQLQNRIVMAPMTRARANEDGTPGKLAARYYGERASVGLVITEGTQPSDDGQGYPATPGIYTDAHVAGWREVTDAIHAHGARVFFQLMHAGRMSHPDNTPHHRQGVAPSAVAPGEQIFTLGGMKDIPVPRALSTDEIPGTIHEFRYAARRAIDAGGDGVEIHGVAYLIHQFLALSSNKRADRYGGSMESRARFAIEVAQAVVDEIGADRTGILISPGFGGMGLSHGDEGPDLYRYLVAELDKLGLAYLHVVQYGDDSLLHDVRGLWHQALILNRPERPREKFGEDIASGLADLESYGQMTLANPGFIERLKADVPLNSADRSTYFGNRPEGYAKGYTDYPVFGNRSAQRL